MITYVMSNAVSSDLLNKEKHNLQSIREVPAWPCQYFQVKQIKKKIKQNKY